MFFNVCTYFAYTGIRKSYSTHRVPSCSITLFTILNNVDFNSKSNRTDQVTSNKTSVSADLIKKNNRFEQLNCVLFD